MAKFTQDIRTSADPNYLGMSKEPDRQRPNTGLGELFANIGEIGSGVVGAVNQRIENQVKTAVYDGVDPLRDAQGVKEGGIAGATSNPLNIGGARTSAIDPLAPTTGEETRAPLTRTNPVVAQSNDSVARLTAAYQAGTISSTHYYGQLEALTRQLRARFPGYREEVDGMIQRVTGVTPANALRAAIEGDLASTQSAQKTAADARIKFMQANPDAIPADAWDREARGQGYSMLELSKTVQTQRVKESQRDNAKKDLELAHANGTFNKETGVRTLIGHANGIFDDTLMKSTDAVGLSAMMKRVQELQASGKTMSPEEQIQLRTQFGQLRLRMQDSFEKLVNTPGQSGESYASMIGDPNEVDKVRKSVMARLDHIEQAITNGDFGILSVESNVAKARENQVYARIMGDEFFATLQGLGRVDKAIPAIFLNQDGGTRLGQAIQGLLTSQAAKAAAGKGAGFTSELTQLRMAYPDGRIPGDVIKFKIEGGIRGVTESTLDTDKRINHAKNLYSDREDGWLEKISKADQRSYVFGHMTSPQVTKAMQDLKNAGGEGSQVWNDYARWATKGFISTMKGSFDQVSSIQDKNFKVVWDDKNKLLVPELTPEGEKYLRDQAGFLGARRDPVVGLRTVMGGGSWDAVNQINDSLRNMRPIWEANGKDVNKEMSTIFRLYEYEPTGKQKEGKGLFDTIKGLFGTDGTPVDEGSDTEKAVRSKSKLQQRSDIDLNATVQTASYGGGGGPSTYRASAGDQITRASDYGRHLSKTEANPIVVAGIIGNGWHESGGLIPDVWGDKGDSLGLFQFNKGGRLPPFQKWAAENGRELTDPYAQLDFALHDLKENHPKVYAAMQQAKSPSEAAHIFMAGYERPKKGAEHADRRYGLADQAFDILNKPAVAQR